MFVLGVFVPRERRARSVPNIRLSDTDLKETRTGIVSALVGSGFVSGISDPLCTTNTECGDISIFIT